MRVRRRERFCWSGAVAEERLSASGKAGHGGSHALEPEEQSQQSLTTQTKSYRNCWGGERVRRPNGI